MGAFGPTPHRLRISDFQIQPEMPEEFQWLQMARPGRFLHATHGVGKHVTLELHGACGLISCELGF
jgi:hypothetical protein